MDAVSLSGEARTWLELSAAQRVVWFDVQLGAPRAAYQLGVVAEVDANVDADIARQATVLLMARHEAMRLRIDDSTPRQWLAVAPAAPLEIVDLSGEPDPARAQAEHIEGMIAAGWELGDRPLFRLDLIRRGPRATTLFFLAHHLIMDSASVGIALGQWLAIYAALRDETVAELPPPSRYLPLVAGDASYRDSPKYAEALAHWTRRFAGAPELLYAATGTGPSRVAPPACRRLAGASHARFTAACTQAGTTAQRALVTLIGIVLARRLGRPELTLGLALHRRDALNRNVIGMLAGVIAVRCKVEREASLLQNVRRVAQQIDEDLRHHRLPIDALVRSLGRREALFDVALSFSPGAWDGEAGSLDGAAWRMRPVRGVETSPLAVYVAESAAGDALDFELSFDPARVSAREVERLATLLLRAVETFGAKPATRVESLDPLEPSERASIEGGWRGTTAVYPCGTLPELIAAQSARTPGAPAVVGAFGTLTYAELDARADLLAARLAERGIGTASVIGVYVARSCESVVTALAIMRAGGAYLPLDPAYPPERLRFMAEDSGATLVLHAATEIWPFANGVALEGLAASLSSARAAAADIVSLTPESLAYVIYTSGSTGEPKGVAMPHRAPVNLAYARLGHDPLGPGDRVLAAISVGFDVSIGQLLLPLVSGATVVIAPELRMLSARDFWAFLGEHGVSHINSVPSFFESILAAAPATSPLRRLMLGGEPLLAALVGRLRAALPRTTVVNMYGPTETCIDATAFVIPDDATEAAPPIGRPLPNYTAAILDADDEPVGIGIPGELCIGGAGLARGYVDNPELTAERFGADPLGAPGERIYRTGDRASWREDGNIEFLGRADTQVKVRGHRVELGEIEARLTQLRGVREAAVVLRAEHRLIAYYTAHDDSLAPGDVRRALSGALPEYMMPAAFVKLERLPLTPNGKLDRKALPEPDATAFAFEAPRGELEETVAAIWADVLGLQRVSRHDNFFEIGGHSLLAMTAIERLRQQDVHVDIRVLFTSPTVAELAAAVGASEALAVVPPNLIPPDCEAIEPGMLPLVRLTAREIEGIVAAVPGGARNVQDIYPLAPLQEGILFQHVVTQRGDAYLSPFLIAFDGAAPLERFIFGLRALIARHDILRTAFVWEGVDEPVQVVLRDADLPTEDVSFTGGDIAAQLLERFHPRHHRLDLRRAPVLYAVTTHDAENDRRLLLLLSHHLVLDHVSLALALDEIRALACGEGANLPVPVSYRNFVAQARLAERRQDHETFFRAMLGDVEETTAPYDLATLPGDGGALRESFRTLPDELSKRLRERARVLGVGAGTLLHAAWALVLARLTGQRDVVFGTVLLGRMQSGAGADRMLGLLINTLPIRIDATRGSVGELVQRTRQTLAGLMHHEHAPLALAQRCSAVPAPAPLFSVLFNYRFSSEATGAGNARWPGVTFIHAEARTNYPLAMAVDDTGDAFVLTAQAQMPIDPSRVCAYLETALAGLLRAFERSPQTQVAEIDVLPLAERTTILDTFNATDAAFPGGSLGQRFEAQVAATPDAVAVAGDGETLSYAGLNARANVLARALVARGVRPGEVVGVALERSPATIVSLLAILKVGAVYLPLDPAYPPERLAYAVADAGAVLVIVEPAVLAILPETTRTLVLDGSQALDILENSDNLGLAVDPRQAAYVIYTSGSTGRPKGVVVEHAAAVNLAFARQAHDPIGVGDRVLAAISVGFDVSIGQLVLPLLSGATVVVAPDLRTFGPLEFWAFLERHGVRQINSVPSYFESVLAAVPATTPLRRLMLGGEALSLGLVRRLQAALPHTEIFNMYGPTEACIDATVYRAADASDDALLPIGRPLPNYTAYVLDGRREPVPIGIAGDLYLGGAGLARGYVGDPQLTAERFREHPFGAPGERLYATGDRARFRADGTIEFLGRADTQVKVRGHRVELGEIEARFAQLPGVLEVAVVLRAEHRLVAFYAATGDAPMADDMRRLLGRSLPDYMVPAAFVQLERLPLTASGKVDRKALPEAPAGLVAPGAFEAPQGALEEAVAAIWADVLGLERVGRHDNFFEIGGHSLLAMTAIERMRRRKLFVDVRVLFTSPTVAEIAAAADASEAPVVIPPNLIDDDCAALSPELLPLARLTQAQLDAIVASVPGGARNVQDVYALAPLQEGILFQHVVTPNGDPYLTPFLIAFDERARLEAFLAAVRGLIARHDVLRTAFVWEGVDEPVQVVLRSVALPEEEVRLAGDDVAAQLLERFHPRHYRLDLRIAPAMRACTAYDDANGRWLLLLMSHHLVLDHVALELAVAEIRALALGDGARLPAPARYRDFVAQARLGRPWEEHEAFFRATLADVNETTAPYDAPALRGDGSAVVEGRASLAPALAAKVRALARERGVGAGALVHAAWAVVLARLTARETVVFGTVLLGRMQSGPDADRMLGLLINTLPLRLDIDGTVAELVQQTRRRLADLLRHEHAPLALAQRCSSVAPGAPLFSVLFNYRFSPEVTSGERVWPGVSFLHAEERTNYPLTMAVDDTGEHFILSAQAEAPIDPSRLCGYLEAALGALVAAFERSAETPVASLTLDMLGERERALILGPWSGTPADYPAGTLPALIAAQAALTPQAVAVVDAAGELTYAEVEAQADRLAARLRERGVGAQSVVGVYLERSRASVVAALGIMRAGGAYLPLDPAYPAARLAFMARDARAVLVLHGEPRWPHPDGVALTELLRAPGAADDSPFGAAARREAPAPASLAYVIYTSGSTGEPKGVAVEHAAAVNLAFARHEYDAIGAGDRVLAATSIGFDVSIGQLLFPLLSGATIVIAPDLRTLSPRAFWTFLRDHGVARINSVPSFIESVLDGLPPAGLALERVMLGGERLSGALVQRLRTALPGVQIVNMYGPTETCIDATYFIVPDDAVPADVPIGRPLRNYTAYILDGRREPVPVGIAGDLYLGGAGLARGYVGKPALTAQRFVPNPFGAGRVYATGDRARWSADGNIEFLGRVDTQVKVRGHRIELGEIEARLAQLTGVREAVVLLRDEGRLVAYYTAAADAPVPEALRASLAASLPDYMVPAAFVPLERLPLTPNGKVDRKALPVPAAAAFVARESEAPRGALEETVAAIWAEVLGLERVGRHENFFEVGGHSLLAMATIERMRRNELHVDIRVLFTSPTVAELAAAVSAGEAPVVVPPNLIPAGAETLAPGMLPLVRLGQAEIDGIVARIPGGARNVQDIYPLAPLQEGILFQHLATPVGDPYLTPFLMSFDRRGRLEAFLSALRELVARHDILRTAFVWEDVSEPVQIVLRSVELRVEELALDAGDGADVAAALRERFDPRRFRLDLREAPVLRAVTARDAEGRWLLLLLSHHVLLDHTSLALAIGEVRAIAFGERALLPEAVPYRNFVAQARLGQTREEHEAFFRETLGDVSETTAPYDAIALRGDGSAIRDGRATVPAELARQLRELARKRGVAVGTLFHAAWALVLARLTGQSTVVFGTVLLGRMQSGSGSDRVLGLLINTLPLRIDVTQGSVEELVRQTQQRLAELMRHEHAPLALAQRCSSVPAPAPLFSVLFNYRFSPEANAAQGDAWPGVAFLHTEERTNYPLTMAVDDTGEDFILISQAEAPVDPGRLCAYLQTTLAELVAAFARSAQTPVRSLALDLLDPAERALIVGLWRGLPEEAPPGTLLDSIAAQAARTPSALAVVGDDATLTYAELAERTGRLATALAARGVGVGTVVGAYLNRSADTVVAALGIMRAGGVYLPLDPAYPQPRLNYLTRDAGASLVLHDERAVWPGADGVALAALLQPHAPVNGTSSDSRYGTTAAAMPSASSLAYVIYTSGSTGEPKGVAVPHCAAVNLAVARGEFDPLGPGDRVLALTSVGFDVSIGQLLFPLVSGATVVIAPDLRTLTPHEFWAFVRDQRVARINSVPSFFDNVGAALPLEGLHLERVMIGGERLSGALVRRLRAVLPGVEIVNMYGPTETCIDATFYVVPPGDVPVDVPIGRPLRNYTAAILNDDLQPVGVGIPGELYIGGAGLARGYVGRPELTAERFVSDPLGAPGDRCYRTGDRARWLPDGTIAFLGRDDAQVKIRGFRVEPGEVEAALVADPAVAQAAVVARSGRLFGYVTAAPGATVDEAVLRASLAATLPDHLVPAAIGVLETLPLTINGKLDARALPELRVAAGTTAPRDHYEALLQSVWQDVMEIAPIGVEDDFFALGGHSLLAMRLIAACGEAVGAPLPLRLILEGPTIAAMANAVRSGAAASARGGLVRLRRGTTANALFCFHPAFGHAVGYAGLAKAYPGDGAVFGLQASGVEAGETLEVSVEAMAARYIETMRGVVPKGPYRLLGFSSGGTVGFEIARQLNATGEQVALLALLDTSPPGLVRGREESQVEIWFEMATELGWDVRTFPPGAFASRDALIDAAAALGVLRGDLAVEHVRRMVTVRRNNLIICGAYTPPEPWHGPSVLVRALRRNGPKVDWSPWIEPAPSVIELDCRHDDLFTPEMAETVMTHLAPFFAS